MDPINKVIEQYILIDGKYSLEGTYVKLEEWEKERLNEEKRLSFQSLSKQAYFLN